MLHLEDRVLAKVDERLELFFLVRVNHGVVEVSPLGFSDLRLLPLLDVGFLDLEVNALDALVASENFYSAEELLEVVQHRAGCFEEPSEPGFVGHVLGQVGEQNREIETDFLGRLVKSIHECVIVDLSVVIRLAASEYEVYFFSVMKKKTSVF